MSESTINGTYATEDERVAAEVHVDESANRTAGLVKFNFEAPAPTTTKAASPPVNPPAQGKPSADVRGKIGYGASFLELSSALEELKSLNQENEETQTMLEVSQDEVAQLSEKAQLSQRMLEDSQDEVAQLNEKLDWSEKEVAKEKTLNKELDNNTSEMEQIIITMRGMVDDKDAENFAHKTEIAELQKELELTQQQVLELANRVESDQKLDQLHNKIESRNDISMIQLKKKLATTEKAFLGAKDRIAHEETKANVLASEVKAQAILAKEKNKEFADWRTEMNDKQMLRERLATEQEKLINSLEEQLQSKKNEIELLGLEKVQQHEADLEEIAKVNAEMQTQQEAHDHAVFELEEKHSAEMDQKDEEIKEEHIKFTAAKEQWEKEKSSMNQRFETTLANQKQTYEAKIDSLIKSHEEEIKQFKASIETLKEKHLEELHWMEEKHMGEMAAKNKEIGRLKEVESDLYDTQIEMSCLQAKHEKLIDDWDSRLKWRKEHEHRPTSSWKPPDTPHPGFGKLDPVEAPLDHIKKFTFTSAPESLGVVVSPRRLLDPKRHQLSPNGTKPKHPSSLSRSARSGGPGWNSGSTGKIQPTNAPDSIKRKVQFTSAKDKLDTTLER